ncbi:MAG: winged helix-turn-helix domain-containing protein [Dehalococcoidia bacterium]|jgi:predicted transcriptional regulator|nr:winged helix-turn-helix domain-containing protein [Dehalococcoidia bacterium]
MSSSIIGARRSAVEVVYDILSVCDNGGINKTAVMYHCNLSYDQLRRYLSLLCEEGLIVETGERLLQTTPAGQKTLERMSGAVKTLRDLRRDLAVSPV